LTEFSKTWWGENWLQSLSHIDYSNRLPRGRSYARNGSVKNIGISGNQVTGKVQGTRPKPYQVTVTVPPFASAQKKILIDSILKNPLLLSKLLNRELPVELDRLARDAGIRIFPSSWKDLRMSCSCPDSAVPCKHIAAVIYIIASEIDKNPFLIFQLHSLDILPELENAGFMRQESLQIPKSSDGLLTAPEKQSANASTPTAPDFSKIPLLADDLLSLLDDKPLFYGQNFKEHIKKQYRLAQKNVKAILENGTPDEGDIADLELIDRVEIILHEDIIFKGLNFYSGASVTSFNHFSGLYKLVETVGRIPSRYLDRLSPGMASLYHTYHFCLKILEMGAFIFQIREMSGNRYVIRWVPATLNEEVEKLVKELSAIIPPGMIVVKKKNVPDRYLGNYYQAMSVSGLILNYLLISSIPVKTYSHSTTDAKVEQLFFGRTTVSFSGIGEAEIPGSIFQWSGSFTIIHKTFVPLLKVEALQNNRYQIDLLFENRKDTLQEPVSFTDFMNDEQYTEMRAGALHSLSRLSRDFKDIGSFIQFNGKWKPDYSPQEFAEVFLKTLPVIRLLGIRILLPENMKSLVRPMPSLLLNQKKEAGKRMSFLNLEEMLDFNWRIALGDELYSWQEFENLVKGLSGIVNIKGNYILIEQKEIYRLMESLTGDKDLSANELLQAALTGEYKKAKISISDKARAMIRELLEEKEIDQPEGIMAVLRPYQQRGWKWLYRNACIGFGSIIADDMGLGKTLQVITLLLRFKEEGRLDRYPSLIIVPTTLLDNWQKEIERFAPGLIASIYHGAGRNFEENGYDMLITSYGILRSDIDLFQKRKWSVVIIDEAQNIKNPFTEQTKAVKKLKSPVRIAMSGTPVENRLSEYWSIFDFTNKGYLGSLKYFKEQMATPIELFRDEAQLDRFRKITSPFILRRLKTDKTIINDLPEKIENDRFVSLTKEQAAIYQNVVKSMMKVIENEENGTMKRSGLIFKLMTALKQVCNHPSQFLKKEDIDPALSGKAEVLLELLQNIYESNEKVLIFTQYKEMGELLVNMIEKRFGNQTLFLHGSVSVRKRTELVRDFQAKGQYKTFILSIKAGGTGLNLTAANHVIHYDLWWNPAVEAQATDRAFRIGQHKNVMVYRLITKGTFEERINEMLVSKKDLANLTVTAGEKWIGELSNRELSELVRL
jgi:uncharacterized Zn finger protein/superfamily II DNA or RNA helicase